MVDFIVFTGDLFLINVTIIIIGLIILSFVIPPWCKYALCASDMNCPCGPTTIHIPGVIVVGLGVIGLITPPPINPIATSYLGFGVAGYALQPILTGLYAKWLKPKK